MKHAVTMSEFVDMNILEAITSSVNTRAWVLSDRFSSTVVVV